jgi:hypothetical protein
MVCLEVVSIGDFPRHRPVESVFASPVSIQTRERWQASYSLERGSTLLRWTNLSPSGNPPT